ncbi:MAG TPA: preprotein translocase subunit SecG [Verrucomicrobiota bacterium]|nr:preprotein translocase subunit SecG [Verrucomicrobiota bacterium]
MSFLIGLLTVVLVLNCLLLILLVLIQLPKKDAGAGLAFGGAATDALFGSGTGNVLTKVTKYGTIVFFVLAMTLAILQSRVFHGSSREFQRALEQQNTVLPSQPLTPAPQQGLPSDSGTTTPAPAASPAAAESAPATGSPAPQN